MCSSKALLNCAIATASVATAANGAITQWRVEDGGNGHYYDIVVTPLQSWVASKAQAELQGGYLASITSQAENDWLWGAFSIGSTPAYWAQTGPYPGFDGPVFGAYRTAGNVWTWLSGETWGWSNFGWGGARGEAGAQFFANSPYWDDISVNGGTAAGGNYSYVVEWSSIPAPGAVALLGAAGLVGSRRRRA